ncbi:MAG: hypothetical protein IGS50_02655 [Synechococcales cyanobacterium C42_A2020_086]|jgi:hypothetical protein|nr:hypothetical protein [Synechococcales cyanobacterium C42_A2020_086]
MFQLLYPLVHAIQPLLVPICFVAAWTIVILMIWSAWSMGKEAWQHASRMHQIPCSNCKFFTGNYHLKCTLHPQAALSEAAIGCPDYQDSNPMVISTAD